MGLFHLLFWAKARSSSYINRDWGFDEYPVLSIEKSENSNRTSASLQFVH